MAVFGLGVGCLMPAYDSLISKVVPEDRRGLAYGLFGTSLGLLSCPSLDRRPVVGAPRSPGSLLGHRRRLSRLDPDCLAQVRPAGPAGRGDDSP